MDMKIQRLVLGLLVSTGVAHVTHAMSQRQTYICAGVTSMLAGALGHGLAPENKQNVAAGAMGVGGLAGYALCYQFSKAAQDGWACEDMTKAERQFGKLRHTCLPTGLFKSEQQIVAAAQNENVLKPWPLFLAVEGLVQCRESASRVAASASKACEQNADLAERAGTLEQEVVRYIGGFNTAIGAIQKDPEFGRQRELCEQVRRASDREVCERADARDAQRRADKAKLEADQHARAMQNRMLELLGNFARGNQ